MLLKNIYEYNISYLFLNIYLVLKTSNPSNKTYLSSFFGGRRAKTMVAVGEMRRSVFILQLFRDCFDRIFVASLVP